MNNLHRGLAPVSDAAWAQIEAEASRTLKRHLAARRVVDVQGPKGLELSAVGTGHLSQIQEPDNGIQAAQREAKSLVELRVPFELARQAIDDVERGATYWFQPFTERSASTMNIVEKGLAVTLSRHWWVLLLRGLVAIAFGVLAWFQPQISLAALVLLFGAYSLLDGVLGVWFAVAGRKEHERWWIPLLSGILGIAIGILTLLSPGITALALLIYIAIWAIATGALQIVTAIRLRKEITGEWLLILGGLASVVFGVLLIVQPGVGALALLWLIATYAVVFGILLVILAFKARTFDSQVAHA